MNQEDLETLDSNVNNKSGRFRNCRFECQQRIMKI
jgi:hypothetical protein